MCPRLPPFPHLSPQNYQPPATAVFLSPFHNEETEIWEKGSQRPYGAGPLQGASGHHSAGVSPTPQCLPSSHDALSVPASDRRASSRAKATALFLCLQLQIPGIVVTWEGAVKKIHPVQGNQWGPKAPQEDVIRHSL